MHQQLSHHQQGMLWKFTFGLQNWFANSPNGPASQKEQANIQECMGADRMHVHIIVKGHHSHQHALYTALKPHSDSFDTPVVVYNLFGAEESATSFVCVP